MENFPPFRSCIVLVIALPYWVFCAVMSSNDSMGIVFKCLSKGAVDFLVKPIRKNELKHLWQHVWRKCHTVSCFLIVPVFSTYARTCTDFNFSRHWYNMLIIPWSITACYPHKSGHLLLVEQSCHFQLIQLFKMLSTYFLFVNTLLNWLN